MTATGQIERGDCLALLPRLEEGLVECAIYDIPYYTSGTREFSFKEGGVETRKSYSLDMGEWDDFESLEDYYEWVHRVLAETRRVLKMGGSLYLYCRDGYISDIRRLMRETGYYFKKVLVWVKTNPLQNIMHVNYNTACEFMLFAIKANPEKPVKTPLVYNWLKQREIRLPRNKFPNATPFQLDMHNRIETPICMAPERLVDEEGEVLHKTQKPVEALLRHVLVSTDPGDTVLDACCGTGSTLEAARLLGRRYLGCEKNEKFCEYARKRLRGELEGYRLSKRVQAIVNILSGREKETVPITRFFK
jgi:modification methylase